LVGLLSAVGITSKTILPGAPTLAGLPDPDPIVSYFSFNADAEM
jgi:hypothetical protein